MIPWLGKHDQRAVFSDGKTFDTPEQQEAYVREWAQKRTGFKSNFRVTFYPGRYAAEKGSILPVGDPTKYIADHEVREMSVACGSQDALGGQLLACLRPQGATDSWQDEPIKLDCRCC